MQQVFIAKLQRGLIDIAHKHLRIAKVRNTGSVSQAFSMYFFLQYQTLPGCLKSVLLTHNIFKIHLVHM